jgi:hypothetical protein
VAVTNPFANSPSDAPTDAPAPYIGAELITKLLFCDPPNAPLDRSALVGPELDTFSLIDGVSLCCALPIAIL